MYKNLQFISSIYNTNNIHNTNNIGFKLNRQTSVIVTAPETAPETAPVSAPVTAPVSVTEMIKPKKIIDLFATRYIENIATALADILRTCDLEVFLHIRQLTNMDIKKCQAEPYRFLFICCPQTLLQAKNGLLYPTGLQMLPPDKYFLYQLEPLVTGSHKFINPNIIQLIKSSKHTFDYSETNLYFYPEEIKWKISYLLPPVVEYTDIQKQYEDKLYDIFFCGYSSIRREKIIKELRNAGYKVFHTTDVFGPALTKMIKQSKIFLNLHNNDACKLLETCRLNESVMANATYIISETGNLDNLYADRVHFIKDTKELMSTVKKLLEKYDNDNETHVLKSFDIESWTYRVKTQLSYIYKDPLLVICNNLGGGSFKFITDISVYYKIPIQIIKNKTDLIAYNLKKTINNNTILLIQSFLFTDFDVDILIAMFNQTQCKIILPIHDWYWFNYPYLTKYDNLNHNLYLSNFTVPDKTRDLFVICDKIICPSKFIYDIIHDKLPTFTNIFMQEWLDYNYKDYVIEDPNVNALLNNKINIGIFHTNITYKGKEAIDYLLETYPDVNFYIVGKNIPMYKETEFFSYIQKYNIHGLLHLNKWGETYCYSLTKALMSGLPILYNNFGSFKERIPPMEKYIVNCSKETDYETRQLLDENFKKFLEYIRINQGTYKTKEYDFNFIGNILFDFLFL